MVKKHCLFLQDEYQINVPLLLFYCWAGCYYQALSPSQRAQAQSLASDWQDDCISSLRHLRERMKCAPLSMKNDGRWQEIRELVKTVELSAEEQLLHSLETAAIGYTPVDVGMRQSVEAIASNIYQYSPELFIPIKATESLAAIIHAVDPEMQYDSVLEIMKVESVKGECRRGV